MSSMKDVEGVINDYIADFSDYLGVRRIDAADYECVVSGFEVHDLLPWVLHPILPADSANVSNQGMGRGRERSQTRRGRIRENIGILVPKPTQVAHNQEHEGIAHPHVALNRVAGHGHDLGSRGRGRRGGPSIDMIPMTILQSIHPCDLDDDSSWSEGSSRSDHSEGNTDSNFEGDWELDELAALGLNAIRPMPQTESFGSKYAK